MIFKIKKKFGLLLCCASFFISQSGETWNFVRLFGFTAIHLKGSAPYYRIKCAIFNHDRWKNLVTKENEMLRNPLFLYLLIYPVSCTTKVRTKNHTDSILETLHPRWRWENLNFLSDIRFLSNQLKLFFLSALNHYNVLSFYTVLY